MALYNQIAGFGDGMADDLGTDVPETMIQPIQILQQYGILENNGSFVLPRYKFLMWAGTWDIKQDINNALSSLNINNKISGWFSDAFKGVQHFAAGLGMQVPRASFLALVRMNAFGYANKLNRALQYQDTTDKLNNLWWAVGGQPDKLREVIAEGATKPAVTTVQNNNAALIELAQQGGTYTDAAGIKHDINTGAVVHGIGGAKVGILPVVAAAVISSAAVIVAAIMPVISKLLDKHTSAVPGLPVDPATGQPVGYSVNPIMAFVGANPVPVAIGAAVLIYYLYENV